MKISSIFKSINGEVCRPHQGSLTTFVRTFGCNCRCIQCDTKYSYEGSSYTDMKTKDIMKAITNLGCGNVTLTGGEPLMHKGAINLLTELRFSKYKITVETNGSIFIPYIDPSICWVADYKLPSSGSESMMKIENYTNLRIGDFVKFVVADRIDFDRSLEVIKEIQQQINSQGFKFAYSPMFTNKQYQSNLPEWMMENKMLCEIGAIYSLQIHKVINVL